LLEALKRRLKPKQEPDRELDEHYSEERPDSVVVALAQKMLEDTKIATRNVPAIYDFKPVVFAIRRPTVYYAVNQTALLIALQRNAASYGFTMVSIVSKESPDFSAFKQPASRR
jgi:hypothetical protein